MNYIDKIFERAKLSNIVDNILYGPEPEKDFTDYDSRMEKAFVQYGKIVTIAIQ